MIPDKKPICFLKRFSIPYPIRLFSLDPLIASRSGSLALAHRGRREHPLGLRAAGGPRRRPPAGSVQIRTLQIRSVRVRVRGCVRVRQSVFSLAQDAK